MKKTCKVCGIAAHSDLCVKHKVRKPLVRTPIKRQYQRRKKSKAEPTKSKRGNSVKVLKPILWGVVSTYIRLRDSDEDGYCKCITCSNVEWWKFMDAGHFKRRRHTSTFIHEKNLGAQCKTCNQKNDGMEDAFALAIDLRWGEGTAEELDILSKQPKRFSVPELRELIVEYEEKVAKLKKEKNL